MEKQGVPTRVQTAIDIREVAEPFIRRRAIRHLEKGRAVIFAAGTGNPYFTTDSAAALRAAEIHADALLKGTQVEGIFTGDPRTDPEARLLAEVTYQQVLERDLKIMDGAAIALCRDNGIPIAVFDLGGESNLRRIVLGERVGSIVRAR
jgi:uridylate kinase